MVGLNMLSVGSALLPLMEELCGALGLHDRVERAACELRAGGGGPAGKRRHGKPPTEVSIHRQAILATIPEVRPRPSNSPPAPVPMVHSP